MAIVTSAEVLEFLSVSASTKLTRIINACNEFAETYCGRAFDEDSCEELIKVHPYQDKLVLTNYPLIAVTSLTDSSGSSVTILATDDGSGIVQITTSYWEGFPVIEDTIELFTVAYSYGFSTIPGDLKLAVLDMIENRYYSGDSNIISERLGDRTYKKEGSIPTFSQNILDYYRKV